MQQQRATSLLASHCYKSDSECFAGAKESTRQSQSFTFVRASVCFFFLLSLVSALLSGCLSAARPFVCLGACVRVRALALGPGCRCCGSLLEFTIAV